MHIGQIIAVAVGLGADAMSVSMGVGVRWHGPRQKFRLAWHMGLFQFLMPVLGWLAGRRLAGVLHHVGVYVAAGLVFLIGVKMLLEALKPRPGAAGEGAEHGMDRRADPTRGWSLIALSVATSIDALVVGFSFGIRGRQIWQAGLVIGAVAGGMALTGVVVGKRLGLWLGRYAEIGGAVVLMALAVSFLWL